MSWDSSGIIQHKTCVDKYRNPVIYSYLALAQHRTMFVWFMIDLGFEIPNTQVEDFLQIEDIISECHTSSMRHRSLESEKQTGLKTGVSEKKCQIESPVQLVGRLSATRLWPCSSPCKSWQNVFLCWQGYTITCIVMVWLNSAHSSIFWSLCTRITINKGKFNTVSCIPEKEIGHHNQNILITIRYPPWLNLSYISLFRNSLPDI